MQNVLTLAIEQAREAKKIKIKELARIMGIDPTSYTRKIKGHNGFTELELLRACKYLGLHLYVIPFELKPLQV